MRKAFNFIPFEEVVTPVNDAVSAFIPDQALGLREMLMKFAYIGTERLEEIVNRGYDGDEDDDLLGVDVGALDYAEVHDRMVDMVAQSTAKSVHAPSVVPAEVIQDAPTSGDGE